MSTAPEQDSQKPLNDSEDCPTDLLGGGRGAETKRNGDYNFRGHKSSDRKTGLGQTDDHYSWREVYRVLEAEGFGHE